MIGNLLDTTPAYVVMTDATDATGRQFGTTTTTVTAGQLVQHTLHMEPADRAAGRIAAGRHESTVTAGQSYAELAAGPPVNVHVLWVLPAGVADQVVAMLARGGRNFEGEWYGKDRHVTANCTGGFSDNRGPRHDRCEGWIAPALGARKCVCPCHDAGRMAYPLARAFGADRMAAMEYRTAVAYGTAQPEYLERRARQWATARGALLEAGGEVGRHRTEPLPAEVAGLIVEAALAG